MSENVNNPYLENRVVEVKPVQAGKKWNKLLVNAAEKAKDPHLFKGTAKVYSVPRRSFEQGGSLVEVLDSTERKMVPEYNKEMTEREYFEAVLNADLNIHSSASFFWQEDKRGKISIDEEGRTLNLRDPLHMLNYKVALANKKYIASSPEEYHAFKRPTQEFVITDISRERDRLVEKNLERGKQYAEFIKKFESKQKMLDFLLVAGIRVAKNQDMKQIQASYTELFDKSPKLFIEMTKDPYYEEKLMISKAVHLSLFIKRHDVYTTDSGQEIGKISDVVTWINNPENQASVIRIKSQIENQFEQEI